MKSIHDHIKLDSIDLDNGNSKRLLCPICKGGSSNENSLSVTRRHDVLVYHCFRDSCTAKGVIGSKVDSSTVSKAKKKTNPYTGKTRLLSDEASKFLTNKFYFDREDLDDLRITEEGDILYPLRDWLGSKYGIINRRYAGLTGVPRTPKTINYFDREMEHKIHFEQAIANNVETIVLVEDVVSARRVAKRFPCVALLTTKLRDSEAALLRDLGVKNVVFLLDADANRTSRKQRDHHQFVFDNVFSIRREASALDPKDCTPAELEYLLDMIEQVVQQGGCSIDRTG